MKLIDLGSVRSETKTLPPLNTNDGLKLLTSVVYRKAGGSKLTFTAGAQCSTNEHAVIVEQSGPIQCQ